MNYFSPIEDVKELEKITFQVRRDIVRMVHGAASGHPGGSLGCTDILVCLFFNIMRHQPKPFVMEGKFEDVFYLSNGHISPVLYSVLARTGYFPISELATFRKINSRLQGHPATKEGLEGIRVATGSLGQGFSVAIGHALGKKLDNDPTFVYVMLGDGEIQEGQIWEAAAFAAHHKVDNLIGIIDVNGQQIDGRTEEVMNNRDIKAKFESFGWQVLQMNGHDIPQILDTFRKAKSLCGKGIPTIILAHTIMGKGVDFMEGTHKWHGVAPNDAQLAQALMQLPETLGDY
ncbi:MAG: transketolase [Bacteroidia bacterium]|nr:transketolase [Bacteroidia bacterium]MDW8301957.1 transketolase [Bacteroidia bacterium]